MGPRIRYLLSDPEEIRKILLVSAAIFLVLEIAYYLHYLSGVHGLVDPDGEPFGRDFISYWTAITLLRAHDITSLYSIAGFTNRMAGIFGRPIGMFWGYPPHYLFLLWPFTFLYNYTVTFAAWSALNIVVFCAAMFWRSELGWSWKWVLLSAPLIFTELFIGQNGLLTAALLIGGFRLLAPMPVVAGIVFGLLTMKPQLGILLPFVLLALRQRRAFMAAVITALFLIALSGLAFGWQSWQEFYQGMWLFPKGAFHKMISVYAGLRSLGVSAAISTDIQIIATVLLIILLCLRLSTLREAHYTQWLMLVLPAVYLATPYVFPYDMCALAGGWVLWLSRQAGKKLSAFASAVWLLLWLVPGCFNENLNTQHMPLTCLLLILAFASAWKESTYAA